MGWSPKVLMHEASLRDMADAFTGYLIAHGKSPIGEVPNKDFLENMLGKFPDNI